MTHSVKTVSSFNKYCDSAAKDQQSRQTSFRYFQFIRLTDFVLSSQVHMWWPHLNFIFTHSWVEFKEQKKKTGCKVKKRVYVHM